MRDKRPRIARIARMGFGEITTDYTDHTDEIALEGNVYPTKANLDLRRILATRRKDAKGFKWSQYLKLWITKLIGDDVEESSHRWLDPFALGVFASWREKLCPIKAKFDRR